MCKSRFNWAGGSTKSDWLRLIQPHAGAGKGFYFIPEIDEEVLVGFEGGNAERPYVMGTHYNGSESSGYNSSGNDFKVIQTRSGNRAIFDDATGDITIESQKGKTIAVIHGDGNMRFIAPKNIEFEAGENIILNAGKDITITARQNITQDAGANHISSAKANMSQSAVGNYSLTAFDISELAQGGRKSQAKNIQEQAGAINKHATKENVTIQGQKKVTANATENSNFH